MDEFYQNLALLAEQAEQEFNASSQGRSVCRLHKQGQVSNRLKYCEGRDYVARRMLRLARQEAAREKLEDILEQLERKHLSLKQSPVLSSPDWQAYADGVLSMVADIRALLDQAGFSVRKAGK